MIGGAAGLAGGGKWKGTTVLSASATIGSIFSSIFRRDCAWRRLRRLVAEAVDEGLQVPALVVLLGLELQLQRLALAPLAVEGIVAAAIERQLALVEMDDGVDGAVQQVAVVADDDDAVGILGDVALQPQRAFEVEIVGRLVEEQQVRPREQRGGERHAHAPAAGERGAGPLLRRLVEAEAGEDGGGARLRRMRIDVGEPRVDLGDAVRVVRRLGLGEQPLALVVGGEHHLDQALRPARRLLRHLADARVLGQADRAALRADLAGDQAEEGGLAGAVRPHQAGLGAVGQRHGGVVDQQAMADPVGEVVDMQHGGGFVPRSGRRGKGRGAVLPHASDRYQPQMPMRLQ